MGRVAIIGAGKSGVAAANFLAARGYGVVLSDSKRKDDVRLPVPLSSNVETVFGEHPESLLDGTELIVLSPGVPTDIPILRAAQARGVSIISEIELAFRHLQGKVIAITGSNGKSTTTALIGEILKAAGLPTVVAGNIGEPLVSAIAPEMRYYVIELSSFQLETVDTFRADVAVLLNITPDHMDRYASLEDYAAAKNRIFRHQTSSDVAVVNLDDPRTANPPTAARVWRFSTKENPDPGAYAQKGRLIRSISGKTAEISRSTLRLEGAANVENALAAWLAAHAAGAGDESVDHGFRSFAGLPHRMVLVREIGGVRYINDSKGTNVDATLKSLEGMPDGKVILILGGKDKKGEFERLRPWLEQKTRTVLTIGSAAEKIATAIDGAVTVVPCGDMSGAVAYARENASGGDTVLLSPACASFDQYNNFEERGRHFEELVRGL